MILWLMPVQVIGEKNRKGTLGSPYAVKDYYAVEPGARHLDDLKHFVQAAHDLGMYVILDWVANHTAWDSNLVTEHPEWYSRDWKGDFRPTPWWDWVDIIDLDYDNPELREYMTNAMKYWVSEADIDGYRCDSAGFVPTDFWDTVRAELDAIKPVFMLAEWEATGSACRGVRHDLRVELERDHAPDRHGQGRSRAAAGLLLVEREGLSGGRHADDASSATTTRTPGRAPSSSSSVMRSRQRSCCRWSARACR